MTSLSLNNVLSKFPSNEDLFSAQNPYKTHGTEYNPSTWSVVKSS